MEQIQSHLDQFDLQFAERREHDRIQSILVHEESEDLFQELLVLLVHVLVHVGEDLPIPLPIVLLPLLQFLDDLFLPKTLRWNPQDALPLQLPGEHPRDGLRDFGFDLLRHLRLGAWDRSQKPVHCEILSGELPDGPSREELLSEAEHLLRPGVQPHEELCTEGDGGGVTSRKWVDGWMNACMDA